MAASDSGSAWPCWAVRRTLPFLLFLVVLSLSCPQMDLHELQVASSEVASIEAALGDARRSVAEAEAERQRLAAEGPAAHRKKDLLDKVG